LTSEIERIKILEGKISQIVEHFGRLSSENARLKEDLKQVKGEKKEQEEKLKTFSLMAEELNQLREEKETVKEKLEALIAQIEKLGI
jgi:uncharacterized protein (UPF0335 family)